MGALLRLDEGRRILWLRFEGEVDDAEFLGTFQQLREWVRAHGEFRVGVTDLGGVTLAGVSSQAVRQLASSVPQLREGFTRVVVAPDDVSFGMSRMFEILGSKHPYPIEIVRTVAEAYAFLGVEELELRPVEDWP